MYVYILVYIAGGPSVYLGPSRRLADSLDMQFLIYTRPNHFPQYLTIYTLVSCKIFKNKLEVF